MSRRFYHGWVLVLVLGVTETASWGVLYYAFSVLVQPMTVELGWTRAATSGALSVAVVTSGLASVPVGRWLDEHGPRLLMTAGSCAAVALVIAWSRVADLLSFYLIWILLGACMATVLYGPAFATVTAWFRRDRARALTVITLMAGLASTIFVPLTAWLVGLEGWRAALVTLAVVLAVMTIAPHAVVLRRRPSDLGLEVDGRRGGGPGGAVPAPELSHSLGEALRHPTFPWLIAAFATFALGTGIPVHFVAYLGDHGYPTAFAASAAGGIGAAQVLGRILFAPIERRFPPRFVSVAVYSLQPLAIAVLLLVPSVAGVLAFVVLFGMSRGADTLLRSTILAGLYGPRRFASIAGVLNVFVTASQAIAPVSLGAVYDATGGYAAALWALAVLSAGAVGAMYLGDRRAPKAAS